MREQWGFSSARELIFGLNAVKRLGKTIIKIGCGYPLLVTHTGIKEADLLGRAIHPLEEAGITFQIFDQVEPEPSTEIVLMAYEEAKKRGHDVVIALGGGSVIDMGKALAALLAFGGDVADYFGEGKLPGLPLPIVAIPTTSGTGSSVSPASVLTDKEANLKKGISDNRLRPTVALVDPLLTLSCPPFLTACTGIDVLAHAVEAYLATPFAYLPVPPEEEDTVLYHGSNPLGDGLARDAVTLVAENLRMAVYQGHNVSARTNMALANIIAGMSFSNAGVTAVHAMAYPLGGVSHAPHGLVNGLLLPHVLEYNMPVCEQKMADVASWMGEMVNGLSARAAAQKAIDHIKRLIAEIGLPTKMREIGVKESDIRAMAEATMGVTRLLRGNPRKLSVDDIEAIFRNAL
jgi:alcohol dehydrogenase